MHKSQREHYRKISGQTAFSMFFGVLSVIIMAVGMPVLTRGLSMADYGAYSIISVTVIILTVILDIGLPQYFLAKFAGMREEREKRVFSSLLFFNTAIIIAFSAIVLIPGINRAVLSFLRLSDYENEFRIGILIFVLGGIFRLFSSKMSADRRIERAGIAGFLYNSLWLVLISLFFVIFGKFTLINAMLIWLLGTFASAIFAVMSSRGFLPESTRTIDVDEIKKALKFTLPLLVVLACSWLIDSFSKYFLNYYSTKENVAIFSFAYGLVGALLTISTVITSTIFPHISEFWHKGKNHNALFNAMLKYGLMVLIPASFGMVALREQIITLVAGGNYLPSAAIILILSPFPILNFLMTIDYYSLLIRGRTKTIAAAYLAGIAVSIASNLILVPILNVTGAALSIIISFSTMLLIMHFTCRTHFKWKFGFLGIERIILASAIMALAVSIINPQVLIEKILTIAAGALIYAFLVWIMRLFTKDEIMLIKSMVKIRK
ncbi:MAG: oligosaccharide flippase family protein [Candidatus Woesearchaeota archaeon]|nr:oligosaccharide flippase family protein [Candidatus Woesearchaeota archaeon]